MVVALGLTLVEPLADVEVNAPGVIVIVAASLVAQLRVLLAPGLIPVGLAVKELMAGIVPLFDGELDEPQPGNPTQTNTIRTSAQRLASEK